VASSTLKKMAEFVACIYNYPIEPGVITKSVIACRKKPKRKPCIGRLIITRVSKKEVHWKCPICGDNGIIRD